MFNIEKSKWIIEGIVDANVIDYKVERIYEKYDKKNNAFKEWCSDDTLLNGSKK